MEQIFPGVWKIVLGQPDAVTPMTVRTFPPAGDALHAMPAADCPFSNELITGKHTTRGFTVELPMHVDEQVYGFGLQLRSFNQRGKKKTLRVNSDPIADLGDSHAPVPFYVSTAGYGVLVDTPRYATFYCAATHEKTDRHEETITQEGDSKVALTTQELYARRQKTFSKMLIEIPYAAGVTLYVFAGPEMRTAVQRYNLFSGGGCLPARWGLGIWYRCRADFTQQQVLDKAQEFRDEAIPCDVLGLEPKWQTKSYSCSFVWNREYFPQPDVLVERLKQQHFRLNLWTHVFTHPQSPIYGDLLPYACDYEVFDKGLVPDFTIPQARKLFADFHAREHVDIGVSGYKLDECDNSDFIAYSWSFPELSHFPSGLDGEQMHSLLGILYQDTIYDIFRKRNERTYNEVRCSHAFAAPYPFVLYSDLYEFPDFLQGLTNCGFSGLLWCPEVRHASSSEDLIRRIQMVMLSPQALINSWYIKNAPWKQWKTDENNADVLLDDWQNVTNICRELFQLRMRLIPYLYDAFFRYATTGVPPFRALVMDYPQDEQVWKLSDQFMVGENLLVAPVEAGAKERTIYLPEGSWVDFWSGERFVGGQSIIREVPLTQIPIFVKDGAVLPLAQPTLNTDDPASYNVTVQVYGDGTRSATLIEDNSETYDYERGVYNRVTVSWDATIGKGTVSRHGDADCPHYQVVTWEQR